jgi:hypothetical protein
MLVLVFGLNYSMPLVLQRQGGNVGIGTTSPTGFSGYTSLDINNATNGAIIDLSQGDVMRGRLVATTSTMAIETSSSVPIIFQPAGTEAMRIDSSGNVGIGTSSPQKPLQIFGSVGGDAGVSFTNAISGSTATDGLLVTLNSDGTNATIWNYENGYMRFATNSTERMRIDSSGNVGIGTSSPSASAKLDVNGNVIFRIASATTSRTLGFTTSNGVDGWTIGNGVTASANQFVIYSNTAGAARLLINSSGNVGIGTSSPVAALSVQGDILVPSPTAGSTSFTIGVQNAPTNIFSGAKRGSLVVQASSAVGTVNSMGGGDLTLRAGDSYSSSPSIQGDVSIIAGRNLYTPAGGAGFVNFITNNTERMRINSSGNVGIGCSPPTGVRTKIKGLAEATNLATSATSAALFIEPYSGSSWGLGIGSISGQIQYIQGVAAAGDSARELSLQPFGGNVGIGESSPDGLLHLKGDTNANGAELYLQVNNNNTTDNLGAINFGNNVDSTLSKILSGTSGANNSSYLTFSTSSSGSQSEKMRIDASGNVGIGTTSPTAGLSITRNGQDYANNTTTGAALTVDWGSPGASSTFAIRGTNTSAGISGNTFVAQIIGGAAAQNALEMYTAGATPLVFGTNATERLRIDSSGNVGIGTTVVDTKLQVVGGNFRVSADRATSSFLDIAGNSTGTNGVNLVVSYYGGGTNYGPLKVFTGGAERMRIDSSGNVGIGTSSPTYKLEINNNEASNFNGVRAYNPNISGGAKIAVTGGTISASIESFASSYASAGVRFANASLIQANGASGLWINAANSTGGVIFATGGSASANERMRITSSGRVGIGMTAPVHNLQVSTVSDGVISVGDFSAGENVKIYLVADQINDVAQINSRHAHPLVFSVNNTERMRIDTSGNLLVGGALADVNGLVTNHLFEGANSTAGDGAVGVYNNTGTANAPALVVLNRDTSTDSSNRFVQFYANVTSSTAQSMGGIVGNGVDNVQFASISDVREKTNIESINGSLNKKYNHYATVLQP